MASETLSIPFMATALGALLLTITGAAPAQTSFAVPVSTEERQLIQSFGPWPPRAASLHDSSNRVSGKPAAVSLGQALFFDVRLSAGNDLSCATCHQPTRAFTDGRDRAEGGGAQKPRLDRNTPTLWNVATAYWYGWDGGSDSLWSFAIRPIQHPLEMGATAIQVTSLVRKDKELSCRYRQAFGRSAPDSQDGKSEESIMVNLAKALGAYMETLVSGPSAFDAWREALSRNDMSAAARYPADARRGFTLFTGRGQCSACHFGPSFSNGEFHDIGIPYSVAPGRVDPGRHGGIRLVRSDPHNRLGVFSDDATHASGSRTRHVAESHATFGQFKVPSLRNVELTAPYMHNGSLATLRDVVRHYSELNEERLHQDGEALLKPLHLTEQESDDLIAFLRSLTSRTFPNVNPASEKCPPEIEKARRSPRDGHLQASASRK
jgi:cytochrome c peroxidase